MEENNNNENKVKEVIKNEVKKAGASILKKIIPTILPAIGVFFLILLAIGVINLIPWLIQNMFASIVNLFNPTEPSSATTNQVKSVVYIDEDGGYNIKVEEFSEQILKELKEQEINVEATGFISENFEDMLDRYIKAEVQTTFPKTGISEIDGIITVKRASTTGEKDKKLKYVSAKEFDEILVNGDEEIFDCFSIDPDTFNLWIARQKDATTYYDANGSMYKTEGGGISKEELDYQKLVQNYSVPLNFWISLHVISQDEAFMKDLLEMALGEEKEEAIVLTYVDSLQTQTIEYEYSGTVTTTTNLIHSTEAEYAGYISQTSTTTAEVGSLEKISEGTETLKIDNKNVSQYLDDISECSKKIVTTYAGELYVTKADTWLKNCDKTINGMETKTRQSTEESNDKKNEVGEPKWYLLKDSETQEIVVVEATNTTNITEKITSTAASKTYTIVDDDGEIKVDEVVELIKSYPKVENNISTSPSNLLYLLQQSENTQKLEKIMRYVLYELYDIDYGILERDLKYILADEDSFIVASNILREYLRYWKRTSAPPMNEDETCYIIEENAEGQLTVGYGVDIEAYKQLFIDNEYPTEIGGEVPIEFVDAIEEKMIDSTVDEVKSYVSGLDLKSYQINALVSRAYEQDAYLALGIERGSDSMDFVESYLEYWDYERDSKYEDKDGNADTSHKLYVQYLSKSATADGNTSTISSRRRRESEWTLFQCGYYQELNQWYTSGLEIIETAEEIHKYMKAYQYTYCVNDNNKGEECQKFGKVGHGWNKTFQRSKTGYHTTCCATYVSWVLIENGLMTEKEFTPSAGGVKDVLIANNWKIIEDPDKLEPGDILYYGGHVDIYAGDGTKYNAGCGYSIRCGGAEKIDYDSFYKDFKFALRVP